MALKKVDTLYIKHKETSGILSIAKIAAANAEKNALLALALFSALSCRLESIPYQ
jgi:hypothetical protein